MLEAFFGKVIENHVGFAVVVFALVVAAACRQAALLLPCFYSFGLGLNQGESPWPYFRAAHSLPARPCELRCVCVCECVCLTHALPKIQEKSVARSRRENERASSPSQLLLVAVFLLALWKVMIFGTCMGERLDSLAFAFAFCLCLCLCLSAVPFCCRKAKLYLIHECEAEFDFLARELFGQVNFASICRQTPSLQMIYWTFIN